jgi:hypothetical protein
MIAAAGPQCQGELAEAWIARQKRKRPQSTKHWPPDRASADAGSKPAVVAQFVEVAERAADVTPILRRTSSKRPILLQEVQIFLLNL